MQDMADTHSRSRADGPWTLLTAHGRTLVEVARNPESRMVDIAAVVGVTERTAQAIVADLEDAGYLSHERVGRRNRYTVNPGHAFRHSAQDGHLVGPFLELLAAIPDDGDEEAEPAPAGASGATSAAGSSRRGPLGTLSGGRKTRSARR
jgi:hypothetical protein